MGSSPEVCAIALRRFGLGARPGDAARVGADPRGYLAEQVSAGQLHSRQQPA